MKLKTWLLSFFRPVKRCSVCGRRLTKKLDRARGMGAVCARKFDATTVLPKINKDGGEDL